MTVNPIPQGYHTVTPYLVVDGAADLITFLEAAFGGKEMFRLAGPGGKVGHAEVRVGDSHIMIGDATVEHTPKPAMLHLYVEDVDATYRKAISSGATVLREPADQFYGDRSAGVADRFGNTWWIATHVEDVPQEEIERRAKAAGMA